MIYFQFYDFQDNYIENFIPFSRPFHYLFMFSEKKRLGQKDFDFRNSLL